MADIIPVLTDTARDLEIDALPLHIVAVDDEPRNLELLVTLLSEQGYTIETAEDGRAGLAAIERRKPDLVLLDVVMPEMDGFQTCRQIKSNLKLGFIPVVLVTGLRSTKDRLRGLEVGADEFIAKPYEPTELVARVRSLARIKHLYDALQEHNQQLERRVAERTAELQTALEQLLQLDRLKSEFISNVSHELRTPLLHVKGALDLLTEGALGPVTREQNRGLQLTATAVHQLEQVVADIVDFDQVHSRALTIESTDIDDAVTTVVRSLQAEAERQDCYIVVRQQLPGARVHADEQALRRILRHLIDNAIKFSPGGSRIEVRVQPGDRRIRFSVSDSGPGISAAEQGRIFDSFYQTDGSSTRRAGGLGLGLSLVRKLLDAHGSTIHVDSQLGRGSTFWFELEPAA